MEDDGQFGWEEKVAEEWRIWEKVDLQVVREEAEVFGNESKDEDWCWWEGNVAEERIVEDDAWDDIEGMVREDDRGFARGPTASD